MTGQPPEKSIFFESGGAVLVIGDSTPVLAVAQKLAASQKVVAVLADSCPDSVVPAGVSVINASVTELSGHLGAFTALGAVPDGEADLGPLSPNDNGFYDLVIDFSDPPLLAAEVSPYGYYPAARNKNVLRRALLEAPRLVGRFRKSKYFNHAPELCAHDSKGVQGCRRCLSRCPADAISATSGKLQVDAFLCRGCGTCTMVCPTGALTYAYHDHVTPLQHVQQEIRHYRDNYDPLHIVLHGSAVDGGKLEQWLQRTGDAILPVACKAVASTGMDTWLGILAMGGIRLTLLVDRQLPSVSLSTLYGELASTRDILQTLAVDAEVITLCDVDDAADMSTSCFTNTVSAGQSTGIYAAQPGMNKRERVWQLIDQMLEQSGIDDHEVELPEGAAFGAIHVNEDCTLCHACTRLCPTNAIQHSVDMQMLLFTESFCVQCGMCQHGCPENAITLLPRLLLDANRRGSPQVLHEEELAACIECGTPIMSQALLDTGFKHVRNHPLFQGDGARAFKLCSSCRIQAAALDQVLARESTHVM